MEAERKKQEREFIPIILTLETQQEVDAIYSVFNNVRLCKMLGFGNSLHLILKQFRNQKNANRLGASLSNSIVY